MQSVTIHQVPVGPMANFSYLVVDDATKHGIYVDPGWDVEKVAAVVAANNVTLDAIWLTHTHFDHIKALPEASLRWKVPVVVHKEESFLLPPLENQIELLEDEGELVIGQSRAHYFHTPGHSPGEVCFMIGKHLITGDLLFVDGCGRVDLPGSDPKAMFHSLKKITTLPHETIIYPGHDYGPTPTSTIGEQIKSNPYLQSALQGESVFFGRRGV